MTGDLDAAQQQLALVNGRPAQPGQKGHAMIDVATTLQSRFVGVTAGLGVPRTLTWNGSNRTAPEIPAGAVSAAMR